MNQNLRKAQKLKLSEGPSQTYSTFLECVPLAPRINWKKNIYGKNRLSPTFSSLSRATANTFTLGFHIKGELKAHIHISLYEGNTLQN